jgi:uncharacterized membrane protein YsdA (DUF1294 family)
MPDGGETKQKSRIRRIIIILALLAVLLGPVIAYVASKDVRTKVREVEFLSSLPDW